MLRAQPTMENRGDFRGKGPEQIQPLRSGEAAGPPVLSHVLSDNRRKEVPIASTLEPSGIARPEAT